MAHQEEGEHDRDQDGDAPRGGGPHRGARTAAGEAGRDLVEEVLHPLLEPELSGRVADPRAAGLEVGRGLGSGDAQPLQPVLQIADAGPDDERGQAGHGEEHRDEGQRAGDAQGQRLDEGVDQRGEDDGRQPPNRGPGSPDPAPTPSQDGRDDQCGDHDRPGPHTKAQARCPGCRPGSSATGAEEPPDPSLVVPGLLALDLGSGPAPNPARWRSP